jgi:hypothetical protein
MDDKLVQQKSEPALNPKGDQPNSAPAEQPPEEQPDVSLRERWLRQFWRLTDDHVNSPLND